MYAEILHFDFNNAIFNITSNPLFKNSAIYFI